MANRNGAPHRPRDIDAVAMGINKQDRKYLLLGAFVILSLALYCVAGTPPAVPESATATATPTRSIP